ncbi:putative motility protein [Aquabacterium sp.]|jgi:Putative motility protein|uniref:putative motility protein n=1 Tax=Aquabacterium sp. TaxID=1872578 RepID=UPI002487DE9A|nr:putative motility protein [Aquabacterium sp.]MDI1349639.1 putative motility protein [Aquabacterium sp.]
MNIGNDASVRTATAAAQSSNATEVQMAVLKKALNSQAASVQPLLDSLPQQPKLATEGAVGTLVNIHV